MVKYSITHQADNIVVLETTNAACDKLSVQLSFDEFCIFMQYPNLSEEAVVDKLWEICDHSQGKLKVQETVQKVLKILRGD